MTSAKMFYLSTAGILPLYINIDLLIIMYIKDFVNCFFGCVKIVLMFKMKKNQIF